LEARLKRRWGFVVVIALSAVVAQSQSPQEQAVWKQEHAYWEYVKDFDLERYRALWHSDFVGWPQSSDAPVRKAKITDWFMEHKAKGEELAAFKLEPAASQAFGDNLVVTHYWVTAAWVAKSQTPKPSRSRITHTWMRTNDMWQIVGGMSAPVTETASPK
jgi:ketosteroid isomerase-like protein